MSASGPIGVLEDALDAARAEIEQLKGEVDRLKCELDQDHEAMSGEICVRQSELDDIAELVGVQKDAPHAAVRDKVAELARAAAQLRLS